MNKKVLLVFALILLFNNILLANSPSFQNISSKESEKKGDIEDILGIKVESIRLSAYGHVIDFRYRVLDEKKALPLFSSKVKPIIIDIETKKKLYVPNAPKVGSLRSFGVPIRGKVYFILFSNPGGLIKKGSKVNVVIGDTVIEKLVVE